MNITVIGTGYVGLVTGTCFAETGNQVTCVDIDSEKVKRLQNGQIPIYEPHLDVLFERNLKQGSLKFTTDLSEGVKNASIIFLALPTPPGENGAADLRHVLDVAGKLGRIITDYKIIINKSTVPVGTAEKVRYEISKNCKTEFDVVSNPEFLREGFAVDDFMKPDRVVIGTKSEKARSVLSELYAPFVRQGNPIYFMDERSAELTKYAANAFLATKISFMNEIANLCEKTGANVDAVRIGIGSDDRIGKRFLFAGIGYGGSCFPKDVQALENTSSEFNYDFHILKSVMKVNESQKISMFNKILDHFGGDISGKKIAVWGLSFKPDTDDVRESPSIHNIMEFLKAGATVSAYDPEGMSNTKKILGDAIQYGENAYDILNGADLLFIATEWSAFRTPDFGKIDSSLKNKLIFDGRNLYDLQQMESKGYTYYSVGRPLVKQNKK
ncbi:MAG: UDP-glucose/GDP-mannose dehydrogenase family protein [Bacteroidetes bacterium]|nr:MAG: UDP-glucose/GDP-mannose dehydrogenase family protein [Bacteroidota bacterium]REK32567.1 MAG: UDP-glucose/GDP-mannose dehydrogenase family protein [Bacteroidota bacterium]REK48986.1 MAG: UDP-glucose/GDP-mannose dehydrogenase family protein [Bacteroidota bacterium]